MHRVSARMETSVAGLTLEQRMGYMRKATFRMEAPAEIEMSKVRAMKARILRA